MAGIDTATGVLFASGQAYADNFMRNFMIPVMADARNNSSVLWSILQKRPHMPVSGRYLIFNARNGRNTGSNAVRESYQSGSSPDLPDPGAQGGKTYSFSTRSIYGRVKIDGPSIRRGKTNGGAIMPISEFELQGIIDDMMVECNRMAHNDGSGRICQVGSVSTVTITAIMNQDIEGVPAVSTPILDKYLEIGTRVAFMSNIGAVRVSTNGAFYVIAVTVTSTTATFQVSLTPGGAAIDLSGVLSANDWVVRASNDSSALTAASTGFRAEPYGIGAIFSDAGCLDGNGISANGQESGADDFTTTAVASAGFQGLAATSANPFNRGIVLDNGGSGPRPLTLELLQQALSDINEINNGDPKFVMSAYPAFNAYVALLTPDKRYANTVDLAGGIRTVTFNDLPWIKDRFSYKNRVIFIDTDEIEVAEVEPLSPLAAYDVPRWERLANKDAYWAGWVTSYNLKTNVRNRAGGVITELST